MHEFLNVLAAREVLADIPVFYYPVCVRNIVLSEQPQSAESLATVLEESGRKWAAIR
jgi:hypothetical protein